MDAERFHVVWDAHHKIMDTIESYAGVAQGWVPSNEGDFRSFKDSILNIILELEKKCK